MGSLSYVGVTPTGTNVATQESVNAALMVGGGPTQLTIGQIVEEAITARATIESVDIKDRGYATASDYRSRDLARNVDKTFVNQPNAPVSLEDNGTILLSRFNLSSTGFLKGPWLLNAPNMPEPAGINRIAVGTLTSTPLVSGTRYQPLAFGSIVVRASNASSRPWVEIRTGTLPTGALIAIGRGRTQFAGLQAIPVVPVSETPSWQTSSGSAVTATMWLSESSGSGTVSMESLGDVAASLFLFQIPPGA